MVNPQFSWESFQSPQQGQQPMQQEGEAEPQQTGWGDFPTTSSYAEPQDTEQSESTIGWLTRNLLSGASRASEQFLGAPGALYKGAQKLTEYAPTTFGLLGKALQQFVGQDKWQQIVSGEMGTQTSPPTPEQLKEGIQNITGEYTKPKTKLESAYQELAEDIGGSFIAGKAGTARNVLINNVGIPAAANAAKQTISHLGFGEDKGTYTKLGVWTALSLLSNVNGRQFATNMINQGRTALPVNLTANLPQYQNRLAQAGRNLLANDPRATLARQQLNGIEQDIQNGQTGIQDLMNRYDAINAAKRDRGLFELGRADRNAARRNIDQVLHAVRDEINHVGRNHPEALRNWNEGMQALAVVHQSQAISNTAQRMLQGPNAKLIASHVAALFGITGFHHPLLTVGATTAGGAVYKGGQVAFRVWENPNLAHYYWNAISAAQADNAAAFLSNYKKLDAEYQKKYGSSGLPKNQPKKTPHKKTSEPQTR